MDELQQLRFDPDGSVDVFPVIVLGRVPNTTHWLVQCPDCGDVRTVTSNVKSRAVARKGHTRCYACGYARFNRARVEDIESTEDLIVIEQASSYSGGHQLQMRVQCPDCGAVFERGRAQIKMQGHSRCRACARHACAEELLTTEDAIILQQFHKSGEPETPRAWVRCPDCGEEFSKSRRVIRENGHTLCQACHYQRISGPNHWNWQGGFHRDYGQGWDVLSGWIKERDRFTCQYPGCSRRVGDDGSPLHVHHIIPFRRSRDNSVHNLITLCNTHHGWADRHPRESIPLLRGLIRYMYGPDCPF